MRPPTRKLAKVVHWTLEVLAVLALVAGVIVALWAARPNICNVTTIYTSGGVVDASEAVSRTIPCGANPLLAGSFFLMAALGPAVVLGALGLTLRGVVSLHERMDIAHPEPPVHDPERITIP